VAKLDYLRLSWDDIEGACEEISNEIESRGIEDYLLVGISRGGLVPLRLISDYLASNQVSTMGVRLYEDLGKTADVPEVFFPVQGDVKGREVILIDDISDTGQSLIAARQHLQEKGASEIVIATACIKPHTALMPDIFVTETSAWVIFPWEVKETLRRIVEAADSRGAAENELEKAGIDIKEYEKTLNSVFGGR
jgi:hypoxanthine phosphoribosyltransferase